MENDSQLFEVTGVEALATSGKREELPGAIWDFLPGAGEARLAEGETSKSPGAQPDRAKAAG
jgi:hypothetical protein